MGLSERLLPKGTSPDRFAMIRPNVEQFKQYRFPSRSYPITTFEAGIAYSYGQTAFALGYALQSEGRQAEAASYYRTAIRIAPALASPYKNLGLMIEQQGNDPAEVISLWNQYLDLNPEDPEAPAIEQRIEQLRSRAR
jgi:tetratricopeptide (TPR) repeat protein